MFNIIILSILLPEFQIYIWFETSDWSDLTKKTGKVDIDMIKDYDDHTPFYGPRHMATRL